MQKQGTKDYFSEKQKFNEIETVGDFGATNLDGNLTDMSKGEQERFALFFKGATTQRLSTLKSSFMKSLNGANINLDNESSAGKVRHIIEAIKKAKNGLADDNARSSFVEGLFKEGGLLAKIEELNKKAGKNQVDLADLKKFNKEKGGEDKGLKQGGSKGTSAEKGGENKGSKPGGSKETSAEAGKTKGTSAQTEIPSSKKFKPEED